MRLNPDSKGMTVVLAMMSAMGPISTDLYVPAFPQLAQDLSTIPAHVQWTMSAYLIGFALAQIFYGPLSDKFGRKPVLMAAFATYLIACLAASIAQSIEWLAAARFLQGVGGAGPIIVARAIVRDMYTGARAGQQLATMSSIMGLAPILSPVIGGVLAVQFGWRASFVAMFTIIATLTAIAALYLPETIKTRMAEPFSAGAMMRSFAVVIKNPVWAVRHPRRLRPDRYFHLCVCVAFRAARRLWPHASAIRDRFFSLLSRFCSGRMDQLAHGACAWS
ncbi:MAG: multidrug effflux MFS transporter [Alphaproteobacteria bacterium]|nr:multidrug effflux MFS transporter [Alphaproteobacteria bacterium]